MCLIQDCIALVEAHDRCGILHRNISVGNIVIEHRDGKDYGLLIDWDHCILLTNANDSPRGQPTVRAPRKRFSYM